MVWMGVVFGVIALVLIISYKTYRITFYSSPKRKDDIYDIPDGEQYEKNRPEMIALIKGMAALPFEQVYITSFDGLKLAARYYHIRDNAPLQIQFHGYRGTALRDFCGGHKLAREVGHNTLVIDQRAHGKSEGKTITFGIKERFDCLNWVEYAINRFGKDTPIILSGISMGAATVLMASEPELPSNVIGIIADSPYSSPKAIISKVCGDWGIPPVLATPFIRLGALLFGRFNLSETSAVNAVKHKKVPVLLIHGENDRFVPCYMSQEIFAACSGKKRLETFPNAGHGISYIEDTVRYERIVQEFLYECQKRTKSIV